MSPPNRKECIRHKTKTLFTTSVALVIFFCPRKIEEIVAPPTAIRVQNAITRFISGKVMASPAIAIAPTPRPIKMLSTILYNEVATLAMIAGTEYCTNNLPMGFVPNVIGDEDCVCGINVN